mgnify:CR=1 FL=1
MSMEASHLPSFVNLAAVMSEMWLRIKGWSLGSWGLRMTEFPLKVKMKVSETSRLDVAPLRALWAGGRTKVYCLCSIKTDKFNNI